MRAEGIARRSGHKHATVQAGAHPIQVGMRADWGRAIAETFTGWVTHGFHQSAGDTTDTTHTHSAQNASTYPASLSRSAVLRVIITATFQDERRDKLDSPLLAYALAMQKHFAHFIRVTSPVNIYYWLLISS